jgi:3-hydroxy-9,10-secoandrosta-1,3,5(10)-triene-9,17-dione monooxygenase reductase component
VAGRALLRATIRAFEGLVCMSGTTDPIDPQQFREVMGRFVTGVTVVTLAHEGELRGMTANAFSSVSLDPALLLVCVDEHASMHAYFQSSDAFAVNILGADQQEVSKSFAQKGEKDEVMGGFPFRPGPLGSPILEGVLAWAECRVEHRYAGGDHLIVVGRVVDLGIEHPEGAPLVFFGGQYRALA